jgi:hypothetical protein
MNSTIKQEASEFHTQEKLVGARTKKARKQKRFNVPNFSLSSGLNILCDK